MVNLKVFGNVNVEQLYKIKYKIINLNFYNFSTIASSIPSGMVYAVYGGVQVYSAV